MNHFSNIVADITLLFLVAAMITTISHLWLKHLIYFILTNTLWLCFLLSFMFPLEMATIDLAIDIASVFCLMLAFLIMHYVEKTPLWKISTYSSFKEAAKQSNKFSIVLVNILISVFIVGLIISVVLGQ